MNPREVKIRLRGVRKTRQITRAMKMVAAVKLRHAQAALANARPYAERMRSLAAALFAGTAPARDEHPFFSPRPAGNILFVVVASDRGLCGSMNANVFRQALRAAGDFEAGTGAAKRPVVHFFLIGRKARDFFRAQRNARPDAVCRVREEVDFAGINAVQLGRRCCDFYRRGEFDRIEFFYNETPSGLQHYPARAALFPLDVSRMKQAIPVARDIILEPPGPVMLDEVVHAYVAGEVRNILMEAEVAEHAARMLMMDLATKNADDLIAELHMAMNKLRQRLITNELADITT
ncbi:MAG: ATP synthase F1 subunit gamma, partial [Kiritimatiellae bacterium]|nr:ATP synthase F1 subunit gamma [Kiritimatiellia bacterium]